MKLGVMPGDIIPASELKAEGFDAMQLFWGKGDDAAANDAEPAKIAATLAAGNDVERTLELVGRTASLDIHKGDNPRSILVWHPSGYPESEGLDDRAIFDGLCGALTEICRVAESSDVNIAVDITRNSAVGSAETFLHLAERVGSSALKVCIDAANFCPDRTPLVRAIRRLAPYTVIAHGKDCSFKDNGEPDTYGPTGSGRLDYDTYIQSLLEFASEVPYFVLEYYKSREDLLKARNIVLEALAG